MAKGPTGHTASSEHGAMHDTWKSEDKALCGTLAQEKLQNVLSLLKQDRWLYQGRVSSAPF